MAKAVIYIKDRVHEVGYRVFAMERLLETRLKGGAVNTGDGRVKVVVEGNRNEILAFVGRLKKEQPELAENPVLTGPVFDDSLAVPDEIGVSHSLQMNQFGKAVTYLSRMDKKLDELPKRIAEKMSEKLDTLPDKIAEKVGEKIDMLPERIAERLSEKLDSLPRKIAESTLPERIADAIAQRKTI